MGRQMNSFNFSRGALAFAVCCAVGWLSTGTTVEAGPIGQPAALSAALTAAASGPFGRPALQLTGGPVMDKWAGLARKLADERVQIALCDGDRDHCVSPAALRFLGIVDQARARDGRARLGEINRAINLAIRPASDLAQYGEIDVWSSPLATFARGAGDCEDYAIAKYAALRQSGIAAADLRIVIIRDTRRGEDHAVAAARLDGHWLVLDNERMAMIEDIDARNVRPLFVLDDSGIAGFADGPVLADGAALIPAGLIATATTVAIAE